MSIIVGSSIIIATALTLGQPCEEVFQELAHKAFPSTRTSGDVVYMKKLALSACNTPNPDIIWQIVSTESAFSFRVVRINATAEVLRGDEAVAYLQKMRDQDRRANVDVGAMQFNWHFHGTTFGYEPEKMFDPGRQVEYLSNVFGPSLQSRCKQRWIGCYHNASDKDRAFSYEQKIMRSREVLERSSQQYLKETEGHEPFRALS